MQKQSWWPDIIRTIICTVLTALILVFLGYLMDIPYLKSQIGDIKAAQEKIPSQILAATDPLREKVVFLEKETADLGKKYSLIAGFLQAKLNFNLQVFLDTAVRRGLSTHEIKSALNNIYANPKEIKFYLEKKLKFNPDEINAIMFGKQKK